MLDGLQKVGIGYRSAAFEVCDGARRLENRMTGPGREPERLDGALEGQDGSTGQGAEPLDQFGPKPGISRDAEIAIPGRLHRDGRFDPRPDDSGGFARRTDELSRRGRLHGNSDIDTVQERPAEATTISGQIGARAEAGRVLPAEVAAGTGIRGENELKVGRIARRPPGADYGNPPFLQRLAQGLENIAAKLGRLVEEKDSAVGQADFAGAKGMPASDDPFGRG